MFAWLGAPGRRRWWPHAGSDERERAELRTGTAPSPEPLDAHGFELLQRQSRLTVFTPGEKGTPDGSIDGVGIALLRRGDRKFVVFDQPDFACGSPEVDSEAAAFDQ